MLVAMSEKVIGDALKNGHGNWRVRCPEREEEYYLRLEKTSLNSESYRLVFSTEERHAWDVAEGRNARELSESLSSFFPNGLFAVTK